MLTTKRKSNGDYSVTYDEVEYNIYKDSTNLWVAEQGNKFITESKTKADLLDKLYDLVVFG